MARQKIRNLVFVLGDQLDHDSAALDDFDQDQDMVWMAELAEEATHVWSHKARIALFLAAMRHYRDWLRERGYRVDYQQLDDADNGEGFERALSQAVKQHSPDKLIVVEPGEYRVKELLEETAASLDVPLEIRTDRHFLCSIDQFREHAKGRKTLRLEYFYRELRKRHEVLLDHGKPCGGDWNYDKQNRKSFSKGGPDGIPAPIKFRPDATTQAVIDLVNDRFGDHPGSLADFLWPVTRAEALRALNRFIDERLPQFGDYQDAMWSGRPFLFHAMISAALNLKLLNPREVIEKAEEAYRTKHAPLNSVEGFIRQVLGWREYVRGIYWLYMPEYLERNALGAGGELPEFYWTGQTDMQCLRQAIGQTLQYGYAHHIQRLMVTGLFAMLLGVHPREVHRWYLAIYVDAVEWVELPNTLGMSQYGDGGIMASKPYAATGKYIDRMSNYCGNCQFDPAAATGDNACPFTTLYWDFLDRHRKTLSANTRMSLQVKNLDRKSEEELKQIRRQAKELKQQFS